MIVELWQVLAPVAIPVARAIIWAFDNPQKAISVVLAVLTLAVTALAVFTSDQKVKAPKKW